MWATRDENQHYRRYSATTRIGELMRYKVIAAAASAASLLAMGITTVETSAKTSYNIDGAATTVTQGPDPTTMTTVSFSPLVKAAPACGFATECDY
jgi:hypothetical protein